MSRSKRILLAVLVGSVPCLAAAYPVAMRLRDYCDLTPSEVRGVLIGFAVLAAVLPGMAALPLRARHKGPSFDPAFPVIVRSATCSLCSTRIPVSVEAHDWARCPHCGALVPI